MNLKDTVLIILLTLILTIPFLDKPIHIDDTFVLRITQQILETPLDPLQGEMDWFGHKRLVWEATTNPPFISYYLAPVAAVFGYSEKALHAATIPFYFLLLAGAFSLGRRFASRPWLPVLFFLSSAAVVVSGNLMRDIPAAGFALSGMALFMSGLDREAHMPKYLGAFLLGLAVLAKYPLAVAWVLVLIYLILRRQFKSLPALLVPAAIVGVWCLHTFLVYGQIHPLYLLLERSESSISWIDKLLGGLSILGSSLFLAPLLLVLAAWRRDWSALGLSLIVSIGVVALSLDFYEGTPDIEFLFWVVQGVTLLCFAVISAFRVEFDQDSVFLVAWLFFPFLFSVFLVPFQATRHLIFALPPAIFLAFRYIRSRQPEGKSLGVYVVLFFQILVGIMTSFADYEYAESYRDFAKHVQQEWVTGEREAWYVGHWGWMFYAERAGLRQFHRDGPYPRKGDLLIWPEKVHIGDVFAKLEDIEEHLELVEKVTYEAKVPVRVMSMDAKAGFYAVIRQRIPIRLNWRSPLEIGRVYLVTHDFTELGR
jgi:hypothetical protein